MPPDIPMAHTSCVILLYDGAAAWGGEDLISEFVVLLVVDVDSEPVSYVVVDSEVYPPSIAVLLPDVFVCVLPARAFPEQKNSVSIKNVYKYFVNLHKLLRAIVFTQIYR